MINQLQQTYFEDALYIKIVSYRAGCLDLDIEIWQMERIGKRKNMHTM